MRSLWILVAVAVGLLLASFAPACSSADTETPPDAALPPCRVGPAVFCATVPPEQPGCSTDDPVSPRLLALPRATRYGVGCTINYVGERDDQGDCRLDAVCKCIVSEQPTFDGGSDAAPNPAASAPPVWLCYP
jgi:hypothetical protein